MDLADPLNFLAKQVAGDFVADFYLEGESGEKKTLKHGHFDPDTKLVIRKITCQGPKGCTVKLYNQAGLVHFVPEGENYASDYLGIVVRRPVALEAQFTAAEAGQVRLRMECDLYDPSVMGMV